VNKHHKSTLRVVIYSGSVPSTTFIERLIEGLAQSGTAVRLVGRYKGVTHYPSNVSKVTFTNNFDKLFIIIYYFFDCKIKGIKLSALYKDKSPNNSFKERFNFLAKALPILAFQPDIFHLQWASDIENWIFLQDYGIRIVCSLRGRLIDSAPLADPILRNRYLNCFPAVAAFHAVSNAIGTEAIKHGAVHNRIFTVYSGLRLSELDYNPRSSVRSETLNILSVGRANWKKGYCHALDACSLLKQAGIEFHYKIVGGVDEEILFQISDLGLSENVTLMGPVDFTAVRREMDNADILLLPSVEEGIANVALEAMATGLPVLSTDCGGMPEVIKDGVTGWLVKTRRPDQLAGSLIRFMKTPVNERLEIASNARRRIEQYHSEETMVKGMMNIYQNCLDQDR